MPKTLVETIEMLHMQDAMHYNMSECQKYEGKYNETRTFGLNWDITLLKL